MSCPSSEKDNNDDDELLTLNFFFRSGFCPERTKSLQAPRRQFISIKESLVIISQILSQIEKEFDLPEGIHEDLNLIHYVCYSVILLPKELDVIFVLFMVMDRQCVVGTQWMRERVNKKLDDSKEEQVCAICLDDMLLGSQVSNLSCNHVFHKKCIDKWSFGKDCRSCPLCRFPYAYHFPMIEFEVVYDYIEEDQEEEKAASTNTSTGLQSIVRNYGSDVDD